MASLLRVAKHCSSSGSEVSSDVLLCRNDTMTSDEVMLSDDVIVSSGGEVSHKREKSDESMMSIDEQSPKDPHRLVFRVEKPFISN